MYDCLAVVQLRKNSRRDFNGICTKMQTHLDAYTSGSDFLHFNMGVFLVTPLHVRTMK